MICPLCKIPTSFYCQKKNKKIYRCQNCGLGMTENIVLVQNQYHRDSDYIYQTKQFENIFKKRVNLITKFQKKGKILEIGSSTGLLLSIFKKLGWQVQGLEISPKAALFAEKSGINTIKIPIERANLPTNTFDVVILNHTLEHLEDPTSVLKKINKLLKKNGLLLISVPNFSSLSSLLLHCRWPLLLPLEHKWHFSKLSLFKILHVNDFAVLKYETDSGVFDYGNPWLELIQAGWGLKKRFIKELITIIPDFIVSKLGFGSGQIIIAKKR